MNKQIWLVEFPTHKYVEDVKALAAQHRLRIVNAKFKAEVNPKNIVTDEPKLTLKPTKKGKAEK
jgi:hypothetical protein